MKASVNHVLEIKIMLKKMPSIKSFSISVVNQKCISNKKKNKPVEMRNQSRENNEISVIITFSGWKSWSNRGKNVWLCANLFYDMQTHTLASQRSSRRFHTGNITENRILLGLALDTISTKNNNIAYTLPYQSKHMHLRNHPFSWMGPQDMQRNKQMKWRKVNKNLLNKFSHQHRCRRRRLSHFEAR